MLFGVRGTCSLIAVLIATIVWRVSYTPPLSATAVEVMHSTETDRTVSQPPRHFPSLAQGSRHRKRTVPPLMRLVEQHDDDQKRRSILQRTYRGDYGWRFRAYLSSNLEEDFYHDVKTYAKRRDYPALIDKYRSRVEQLVRESEGRVAPGDAEDTTAPRSHMQNDHCASDDEVRAEIDAAAVRRRPPPSEELFSRFVYEFACLGEPCDPSTFPSWTGWRLNDTHTSIIEPLFGTLRHPRVFLDHGGPEYVLNKEYMMIDKWALHHLHTRYKKTLRRQSRLPSSTNLPKKPGDGHERLLPAAPTSSVGSSIFVDMGASTFLDGGGGASQKWFVDTADNLCVSFTDMFLFEATPHKPQSIWDAIPDHLHAHYRWLNYPVNASLASWRNPLNILLAKVRPDDTVLVKIDFDTSILEAQLVDTILQFPELFHTIDELFYEHHVRMPYMYRYWRGMYNASLTITDSIDVFRELRRRGIRAHSWV
jgi:hypothetical protein